LIVVDSRDDPLADLRGPTRDELAAIEQEAVLDQFELALLDMEIAEAGRRHIAAVNAEAYAARQQHRAALLTLQLLRTAPQARLARCWPDRELPGRTA
jgi:hypothetical protein